MNHAQMLLELWPTKDMIELLRVAADVRGTPVPGAHGQTTVRMRDGSLLIVDWASGRAAATDTVDASNTPA